LECVGGVLGEPKIPKIHWGYNPVARRLGLQPRQSQRDLHNKPGLYLRRSRSTLSDTSECLLFKAELNASIAGLNCETTEETIVERPAIGSICTEITVRHNGQTNATDFHASCPHLAENGSITNPLTSCSHFGHLAFMIRKLNVAATSFRARAFALLILFDVLSAVNCTSEFKPGFQH
jgi:hypothetical protein